MLIRALRNNYANLPIRKRSERPLLKLRLNSFFLLKIHSELPWLLKPVITLYHLGKHTKGKARAVGRGKKVEADSHWCFKRGKRDTHGYFSPPKTSTHLKMSCRPIQALQETHLYLLQQPSLGCRFAMAPNTHSLMRAYCRDKANTACFLQAESRS